jgi:hypothetical protein
MYHSDSHRRADELLNFAESFQKFSAFDADKEEEQDSDLDSVSEFETEDHEEEADSGESSDDGTAEEPKDKDKASFLEDLSILLNPDYHLVYAFPTFCKVYAIVITIPISCGTAKRSFSALKRVKTRT